MKTLAADGLVLAPLTVADVAEMFELLSDPELYRHLDSGPPPSLARLYDRYARLERRSSPDGRQAWLNWIVRLSGGRAIGYVQATLVSDDTAWIGYLLTRSHWGRGHARGATRAMLQHLVADHGSRRFLASVEAANARSIALLAALAFRPATADELASHTLTASERLFIRSHPSAGRSMASYDGRE